MPASSHRVEVKTAPPAATVYLDGHIVAGTTPTIMDVVDDDFHEVRVERAGYETLTEALKPEDRQSELMLTLEPEKAPRGVLMVDSDGAAEVWIDGVNTDYLTPTLGLHVPVGDHTGGAPTAPDFFSGWWGYVSKDLRDLFGPTPNGAWGKVYCGGGSESLCRQRLQDSLREALAVTPGELYGHGDCEDDPEPYCYDQNRSISTSAISIPPAPFQNRPTFQQTVSVKQNLP